MTVQRRIHAKPVVFRRAVARGELRVAPATGRAVAAGRIDKGDPVVTAEVAGLAAMKRTAELIPHCHSVPLTGASVAVRASGGRIRAEVVAETLGRTGVEMEALVGVTVALLTVWDMVKYLEKDERGGYPRARIDGVRVVAKTKRAAPEAP